jgi:hypothetical protein
MSERSELQCHGCLDAKRRGTHWCTARGVPVSFHEGMVHQ